MEPVQDLPAGSLPAGWSTAGAGNRDPEQAQREAQQVLGRICHVWERVEGVLRSNT